MSEFRMDGVIIFQKDEKEYGTIATKEPADVVFRIGESPVINTDYIKV